MNYVQTDWNFTTDNKPFIICQICLEVVYRVKKRRLWDQFEIGSLTNLPCDLEQTT